MGNIEIAIGMMHDFEMVGYRSKAAFHSLRSVSFALSEELMDIFTLHHGRRLLSENETMRPLSQQDKSVAFIHLSVAAVAMKSKINSEFG